MLQNWFFRALIGNHFVSTITTDICFVNIISRHSQNVDWRLWTLQRRIQQFYVQSKSGFQYIHKLASNEKNVQEVGELEAKHYLGESNEEKSVILNEDTIDIKIKNDRTVINRKALLREDNPETQSTGKWVSTNVIWENLTLW